LSFEQWAAATEDGIERGILYNWQYDGIGSEYSRGVQCHHVEQPVPLVPALSPIIAGWR
jgi:hypothetical protein